MGGKTLQWWENLLNAPAATLKNADEQAAEDQEQEQEAGGRRQGQGAGAAKKKKHWGVAPSSAEQSQG